MEEYRKRIDLLDEKGRLTRPGRSDTDDFFYNKENAARWGNRTEWERYFVTSPRFALEIRYGHTQNSGTAEVCLTDLETDERFSSGQTQRFPGDAFDLDFSCDEEHTVKFENNDLYLLLTLYGGVRRIQFRSTRFEGDLSCGNGDDGIYTAEPLSGKCFLYRGAKCFSELSGYLRMHNLDYVLDGRTFFFSESIRALLPRSLPQLYAFGSAEIDGHVLGLSLTDGADAAAENALFYDGRLCKLDRVYIKRAAADPLRPWYISDSERRLHLEFSPEHICRCRRSIFKKRDTQQYFGALNGTVTLPEGETLEIENMIFACEDKPY